MKQLTTLFLLITFVSGCSTVTEAGYYWGDYSSTLYALTKSPSEKTRLAHEEQLQKIIEYSLERGLKVPPGIYAELGYVNSKRGNAESAAAYYSAEIESYPESKHFLERVMAMVAESDTSVSEVSTSEEKGADDAN